MVRLKTESIANPLRRNLQFNSLTLLLLTALVASLLGYFYLLGRMEQLKQQLVMERWQHPRYEATTPSKCVDIHCVLRTETSEAALYTFDIRTGEHHTLTWSLDGMNTEFESFWNPANFSHCSEISLVVIPKGEGLVAVTVLINRTNRLTFSDGQSGIEGLLEPPGNGYGSGGCYSEFSESKTLIEWNGEHKAKLLLDYHAPVEPKGN